MDFIYIFKFSFYFILSLLLLLYFLDRTKRLGNLRDGVIDVKKHRFFKGIDWEALLNKQTIAPIIPVADHDGDTSNFEEYEEEEGFEYCTDPTVVDFYEETFKDF